MASCAFETTERLWRKFRRKRLPKKRRFIRAKLGNEPQRDAELIERIVSELGVLYG